MIAPSYQQDRDVVRGTEELPEGPPGLSSTQVAKRSIDRFVRHHPKSMTAAALALGITVGWLVKRANFHKS